MKTITTLFVLLLATAFRGVLACEVCKSQQPKGMADITHGLGPQGNLDYWITGTAVVLVGITLFLSLKFLIRPGERQPGHIKNSIIE